MSPPGPRLPPPRGCRVPHTLVGGVSRQRGDGDPGAHPLFGAGTTVAGGHSGGWRYGRGNREFTYYGRKNNCRGIVFSPIYFFRRASIVERWQAFF